MEELSRCLKFFSCFLPQGPQSTLTFSLSGDQTALSYFRLTGAASISQGRYTTSLTYVRPLYLDNADTATYSVSEASSQRSLFRDLGSEWSLFRDLGSEQSLLRDLGSERSLLRDSGSEWSLLRDLGSERSLLRDPGSEQSLLRDSGCEWSLLRDLAL